MSSTPVSRAELEAMDRDELVDVVLELAEENEKTRSTVGNLLEDLVALETRFETVESRNEDLEAQVRQLSSRVEMLESRTDVLQLVEKSDDLDAKDRSVAVLLHMQREIQKQDADRTVLTPDQVDRALNHPDIHRTTLYEDMKRCERLVGDDGVCKYHGDGYGDIQDASLVLNLAAGELPADVRNGGAQQ